MTEIYDFQCKALDGKPLNLADYRGKVMLLVNTASKCGLTPQYQGLQALHEALADKGLAVIGFPCNQFGAQEPGSPDEIGEFCTSNYGVTFTLSEKIEVNGDNTAPLYKYLKANAPEETPGEGAQKLVELLQKSYPEALREGNIKWNFTKFLVDRNGQIVARFDPTTPPEQLRAQVERLL